MNHSFFLSTVGTFLFLSTPPSSHAEKILKMDSDNVVIDSGMAYPILFMPKKCTTLETNFEISDNVYINVNITSPDTEGNDTSIYNGYCNVKLVETFNVTPNRECSSPDSIDIGQMPVIFSEANQTYPPYSQSQVWIDPSRSPYVYNHYDPASQESYSIRESGGLITVEQHNTYITQNVYNCMESNMFNCKEAPTHQEGGWKRYRKVQESAPGQLDTNLPHYGEDEFQCGVFLSQLPEEIMNETQSRIRDEKKFSCPQENNALKQLMSPDIQSSSRQRKTILYLGQDSHSGQTIQNISYSDPGLRCSAEEVDNEVVIGGSSQSSPTPKKKYQCDNCKKLFPQISLFRQHMVGNHKKDRDESNNKRGFMCLDCGKSLKNRTKFELHCLRHGDPDLECPKCGKVFASKFSLRIHMKIHNRKYPCNFCVKSYATSNNLRLHLVKSHSVFMCTHEDCSFVTQQLSDFETHQHKMDKEDSPDTGELKTELQNLDQIELLDSDLVQENVSEASSIDMLQSPSKEGSIRGSNQGSVQGSNSDRTKSSDDLANEDFSLPSEGSSKTASLDDNEGDRIRKADSVIETVMTNSIFLLSTKKAKVHIYRNTCKVCQKSFERMDDLKRHLIEHVIKSTLAKTPVTHTGRLNITCEVCQTAVFHKVDKYKAHLREHAKLTIYKCTFCDKSFSDSSNFSKHKKIHSASYLQCDLCFRKFNSKKMIAQHLEQHRRTAPVRCALCARLFHFQSMLNKHLRSAHRKDDKHRCRFCDHCSSTVKEKWEHEWQVHSVRKTAMDCRVCGAQYRKYSELRRHCLDAHCLQVPANKHSKRKYRELY